MCVRLRVLAMVPKLLIGVLKDIHEILYQSRLSLSALPWSSLDIAIR
jgi:hypothetical protein